MLIEKQILADCRANKRPAQEQLYRICYAPLMKILYRYFQREDDAIDTLNAAMLKVLTRLDQFNGTHENWFAWIRQVAIREALDQLKKKSAWRLVTPTDELPDNLCDLPYQDMEGPQEEVLFLLRQLPLMSATVFNLFALEGYTHEEIAVQLNISISNSKWHLFNARKKLQKLITSPSNAVL